MIEAINPKPSEMVEQVLAWLDASQEPSRNRDFNRFFTGEQSQALKLFRSYSSLLREIQNLSQVPGFSLAARRDQEFMWVEVSDPRMGYRRMSRIPLGLRGHLEAWLKNSGLKLTGDPESQA